MRVEATYGAAAARRLSAVLVGLAATLVWAPMALAQSGGAGAGAPAAPGAGVAPAAAAIQAAAPAGVAVCDACHGPGGNSQVPTTPSIAGQPKLFVENQLVLIREGLRDVPVMTAVVKDLSDDAIVALARHYAAQAPLARPGNADTAKQRAGAALSKGMLCGTCHLPGYVGQNQVPRLSRQNEAYLQASLRQFRDNPGPGRDTIMSGVVRGVTDADLDILAHYLANHTGAPGTP